MSLRRLAVVAAVLAVAVSSARADEASFLSTVYRLPNSQQQASGRRQYELIASAAGSEGLWDKLWGTDCFSRALRQFSSECRDLKPSQKARLAYSLTRCQLEVHGEADTEGRLRCSPSQLLKHCLDRLTDREANLYVSQLSHIDTSCLFIQNLNFEASAERTLNNLVSYNIKNERMVRLMTGELDVLLSGMARLNNATEAAAMFSAQLNEVAATTRDVRDMLSAIHQTAMVVETQQKSLADTVTSLVALQQEATATLAGILASDVTLQDAVFYALAIISLVLATSIGVPAKLRGVYFVWLAIVLAVERAFPLTAGSKVVVRKFVALVVATAWFLVEWSHRVGRMATKRRRGSTTAKAAEWSPPATTTAQRRSPRATRKSR